jgi:hypothetical protein
MKETIQSTDKPFYFDKKHEESYLSEKTLTFTEVFELMKTIDKGLSQKQIDEIIEELGIKKQQIIKLDNLLSKSKEKRKSSKFAYFYGSILNYFITPSERISQILEDSKNKLSEYKEYKLVEDLEWVIKKINSDDLYNLNLDTFLKEENLLKTQDKNLDIESTMNFISEYSKDNFNKNKIKDITEARRASKRRMNLNFKRSISYLDSDKPHKVIADNVYLKDSQKKRSSVGVSQMEKISKSHNLLKNFEKITEVEQEDDCTKSRTNSRPKTEKISLIESCAKIREEEAESQSEEEEEPRQDGVEKEENDSLDYINNIIKDNHIDSDNKSVTSLKNFNNNIASDLEDDCLFINEMVKDSHQFNLMDYLEDDSFDIFEYCNKIGRLNVLKEISNAIFLKYNLFFLINQERFITFLDKIRVGYDYLLPYHNDIHAADVLQTCNIFNKYCNLSVKIDVSSLDLAAYYIAAIIHDYRHPGLNNNYHINKRTPISIKYNDVSVLENFHVSSAFKIISHPNSNIFCDMSVEEYRVVRKRIVECVLATDMAKHTKSQIGIKIKVDRLTKSSDDNVLSRFITDASEESIFERQQEILNFFIHCADISNPAKKFKISKIWTNLVIEEFFQQGDLEKKENLPVSFLCDRNTTNVSKSQILFISNIVLPSFKILVQFSNNFDYMIKNMCDNIEEWKKEEHENNNALN